MFLPIKLFLIDSYTILAASFPIRIDIDRLNNEFFLIFLEFYAFLFQNLVQNHETVFGYY
jgi:hypothetical protein